MKAIKASEERAIKREFNLTETEGWYLEDVVDKVNRTKGKTSWILQHNSINTYCV